MNSRYNIGKIIYKVDAFVDQSQKSIKSDNLITNTIFIDSFLSLGRSNDLSNIIMKQEVNDETWEIEDASLYTPYLNIGKELKYDGQYKTIINENGLYTDKFNVNNFSTNSIKIVNDNEEVIINLDELGIKLNNKLLTDITYGTITETDSNKIIATKQYVDSQIIHSGNIGKYYEGSVFGEIFNDYYNNIASGDYSHAEGYNTTASGKYTYAGGYNTISNVNNMFSIGKFNNDINNDNKLFVVGNGSDSDRNDAFVVYDNGNVYCDNNLKIKSLTLNYKIINDITNESEESDDKILATKYYVDNHGGSGGSGVGQKTNNNGGERFNDYVHNTAEGYYAHAEGYNTHAEGDYSHSSGYNTISNNRYMTSIGKYNKVDDLNNLLFVIGNGSSDTRHNAFYVDENGNTYIDSDLNVNKDINTSNLDVNNTAIINNLTVSNDLNVYELLCDTINVDNNAVIQNATVDCIINNDLIVSKSENVETSTINNLTVSNSESVETSTINNLTVSNTETVKNSTINNLTVSNTETVEKSTITDLTVSNTETVENSTINNLTLENNLTYKDINFMNNRILNVRNIYNLENKTLYKSDFLNNNYYLSLSTVNNKIIEDYSSVISFDFKENYLYKYTLSDDTITFEEIEPENNLLINVLSNNLKYIYMNNKWSCLNVGNIDINNTNNVNGEIFNDYENNKATGNYSHASGKGTTAYNDNMTVIGQYNVEGNKGDGKLFIVGNGSDNINRNDAFVVYNDGKIESKKLVLNDTEIIKIDKTDDDTEDNKTLVTKAYITQNPITELDNLTITDTLTSQNIIMDNIEYKNDNLHLNNYMNITDILNFKDPKVTSFIDNNYYISYSKHTSTSHDVLKIDGTISNNFIKNYIYKYDSTNNRFIEQEPTDHMIVNVINRNHTYIYYKYNNYTTKNDYIDVYKEDDYNYYLRCLNNDREGIIQTYKYNNVTYNKVGKMGAEVFNCYNINHDINNIGNIAIGEQSHAEGMNTTAIGHYTHSENNTTIAYGMNSHAEGSGTKAEGVSSHAEGNQTISKGDISHAEGYITNSSGLYSHSEGNYTYAIGDKSHTEGYRTYAYGNNSHAEGNYTTASGENSHSSGLYTISYNDNMTSIGQYNIKGNNDGKLFVVGNGEDYNNRSDAFIVYNTGNTYIQNDLTIGHNAEISDSLIVENNITTNSITYQNKDYTNGRYMEIENFYDLSDTSNTNAYENGKLYVSLTTKDDKIENYIYKYSSDTETFDEIQPENNLIIHNVNNNLNYIYNIIKDDNDNITYLLNVLNNSRYNVKQTYKNNNTNITVIGQIGSEVFNSYNADTTKNNEDNNFNGNIAVGKYSHAEGYNTIALGNYSHAEGYNVNVEGDYSHGEGFNTYINIKGAKSHVENEGCSIYSADCHAEGFNTRINESSEYSHVEGWKTTSNAPVSHVEGAECSTTKSAKNAHVEGNKCTVSAWNSHAEGNLTTASGDNSHSQNLGTIAYNDNMTVIGHCNKIGEKNDGKLFVVGNGEYTVDSNHNFTINENARSDAFVVYNDGKIESKKLVLNDVEIIKIDKVENDEYESEDNKTLVTKAYITQNPITELDNLTINDTLTVDKIKLIKNDKLQLTTLLDIEDIINFSISDLSFKNTSYYISNNNYTNEYYTIQKIDESADNHTFIKNYIYEYSKRDDVIIFIEYEPEDNLIVNILNTNHLYSYYKLNNIYYLRCLNNSREGISQSYTINSTDKITNTGGIGSEVFNSYGTNLFDNNIVSNIAIGDYSHAEGYNTIALGNNSHASGNNTVTYAPNMTVIGSYNIIYNPNVLTRSHNLFVVGNGTKTERKDAFTISSNGNSMILNSLKIGKNGYYTNNYNIKNELIIGQYNTSKFTNHAFVIGNGTDSSNRSDLFYINYDGEAKLNGSFYSNDVYSDSVNVNKEFITCNMILNDVLINNICNVEKDETDDNKSLVTKKYMLNNMVNTMHVSNLVDFELTINDMITQGKQLYNYFSENEYYISINDYRNDDWNFKKNYIYKFINNDEKFEEIIPINNTITTLGYGSYKLIYFNGNWDALQVGNISLTNFYKNFLDHNTITYSEIFNDYENNISSGYYSHAEGYNTKATGDYSHAEGYKTYIKGEKSHAENEECSIYSADCHAEGFKTRINESSDCSHVEGYQTISNAPVSHVEGSKCYTTLSAKNAHVEGNECFVSAWNSHAEGNNTKVYSENSHTEGYYTIANGNNSHAEGNYTTANGENSHAGGLGTNAYNNNMTVIGQYNINGNNDGKLFVVGNGENDSERSDAFIVYNEGKTSIQTSLNIGEGTEAYNNNMLVLGKYNIINNVEDDNILLIGNGENDENRNNVLSITKDGLITCDNINYNNKLFKNNRIIEINDIYNFGGDEYKYIYKDYIIDNGLYIPCNTLNEGYSFKLYTNVNNTTDYKEIIPTDAENNNIKLTENYIYKINKVEDGNDIKLTFTEIIPEDYLIAYILSSNYTMIYINKTWRTINIGNVLLNDHTSLKYNNNNHQLQKSIVYGEIFNDYTNNKAYDYAHAEGSNTNATGMYSHAEGYKNTSSGYFSHSEGNSTISSGKNSHSEGENTKATGQSSHSEGKETYASCNTCHTEGWQTYTYAHNTHVGGEFNIADNKNETVVGMCNVYNPNYVKFKDTDNKRVDNIDYIKKYSQGTELYNEVSSSNRDNKDNLFVVGNGDYNTNVSENNTTYKYIITRSNAFTVNKAGDTMIQRYLTLNNKLITNITSNSLSSTSADYSTLESEDTILTNKSYVNDRSFYSIDCNLCYNIVYECITTQGVTYENYDGIDMKISSYANGILHEIIKREINENGQLVITNTYQIIIINTKSLFKDFRYELINKIKADKGLSDDVEFSSITYKIRLKLNMDGDNSSEIYSYITLNDNQNVKYKLIHIPDNYKDYIKHDDNDNGEINTIYCGTYNSQYYHTENNNTNINIITGDTLIYKNESDSDYYVFYNYINDQEKISFSNEDNLISFELFNIMFKYEKITS